MTDIDVVIVREGKTVKGKVLGFVLGTIGQSVLKKAFQNSFKAIEGRVLVQFETPKALANFSPRFEPSEEPWVE